MSYEGKNVTTETQRALRKMQEREEITHGYRVDSGYRHHKETTIGDVIDYETIELGNDIGVTSEQLGELAKLPASRVLWITRSYNSARRYGKPEKIDLPVGSIIIGSDGEGGVLVVVG
jgi:hypothetical protein